MRWNMTITLPPDLKVQMRATLEQVNWSALAAEAFEAKLAEIAAGQLRERYTHIGPTPRTADARA